MQLFGGSCHLVYYHTTTTINSPGNNGISNLAYVSGTSMNVLFINFIILYLYVVLILYLHICFKIAKLVIAFRNERLDLLKKQKGKNMYHQLEKTTLNVIKRGGLKTAEEE